MEPATWAAFAAAWALLVVLPGPDTALAVKHALVDGRASAARAAAGSCTALAVHVAAAGLGLSAVLASSATAFTVIKLAGAAFLVFLGLRLILARHEPAEPSPGAPPRLERRSRRPYLQGLVTGLSNPKTALFFLTFLPQFLDPAARVAPALAILAVTTVALAAAWLAMLILLAGRLGALARRPRVREVVERLTGTVFVVLGSRLVSAAR